MTDKKDINLQLKIAKEKKNEKENGKNEKEIDLFRENTSSDSEVETFLDLFG